MRMIGIGLTGFLLAGIALLLSTMNILERGQQLVRDMTHGSVLVFEHRLSAQVESKQTANILRSNPDHPVILSGFPAYQSVAFSFPKDARPLSGYLQFDVTAQVLAGVEGVLRISITGTRRGALLLRPGEAGRSLQIPLSPSDFASDQLVVSFSLQGTDPQHQCGPEDGISAIVEIETTSALHLTLNEPLASARDRFHAWGDVMRVAWPAWLHRDEQARRLILGSQAKQRGLQTQFVPQGADDALNTAALREALATLPKTGTSDLTRFPAKEGANAGVRRFYRSVSWRARYTLADGTGHRLPAALDMHLALGHLRGDHQWLVSVTLNNRLLGQESVIAPNAVYKARLDLPSDWQDANNQIEVTAATDALHKGPCHRGPELLAEMLPETQLIPGDKVFAGPVDAIRAALEGQDPLHVSLLVSLTALQAGHVATWLAQVAPQDATLKPARTTAQIVVAGSMATLPTLPETGPVWVLTQGRETGQFEVTRVSRGQALPTASLFLLVVPTGVDVGGVPS